MKGSEVGWLLWCFLVVCVIIYLVFRLLFQRLSLLGQYKRMVEKDSQMLYELTVTKMELENLMAQLQTVSISVLNQGQMNVSNEEGAEIPELSYQMTKVTEEIYTLEDEIGYLIKRYPTGLYQVQGINHQLKEIIQDFSRVSNLYTYDTETCGTN